MLNLREGIEIQQLRRLKKEMEALIASSHQIVFFGGAGVSTESGIPDFRSAKGLYNRTSDDETFPWPAEIILSHAFFLAHTDQFFRYYRSMIVHQDAKPNRAHKRLADLEKEGRLSAVITQNIDGLHQIAGAKNVLELHGSIHQNTCMRCLQTYDCSFVMQAETIPRCHCGGVIKPDVVLYGEPLDETVMLRAIAVLEKADLLIVGGTSLSVYPAAGLIDFFHQGKMILINQTETERDQRADLVIRAPIGVALSPDLSVE